MENQFICLMFLIDTKIFLLSMLFKKIKANHILWKSIHFFEKKLPSLTICNDSTKKTIVFKTGSKLQTLAREKAEQYKKTSNNFVWDYSMKLRQDKFED